MAFIRTENIQPNLDAHMPALDGLRGLAILMILAVHFCLINLSGNLLLDLPLYAARFMWVGVDLFFILSGFLITGILLRAKNSPAYFQSFYARRFLRIFPLYYAVLFLVLFVLPNLLGDQMPISSVKSPLFYFLYLSNFSDGMGYTKHPFLHVCWSLAVEEHFYLVWPLIVWRYSRDKLRWICVGLMALSLFLRVVLLQFFDGATGIVGLITPCRLDAIALGSLLAILLRDGETMRARVCKYSAAILPAAFLGCCLFAYLQETQSMKNGHYVGQSPYVIVYGYTCVALLFGALMVVVLFSSRESLISQFFHRRELILLGKISFSLYLLHEPVRHFTAKGVEHYLGAADESIQVWLVATTAGLALSILAAWLSWRYFETPILGLKRHFEYGKAPAMHSFEINPPAVIAHNVVRLESDK